MSAFSEMGPPLGTYFRAEQARIDAEERAQQKEPKRSLKDRVLHKKKAEPPSDSPDTGTSFDARNLIKENSTGVEIRNGKREVVDKTRMLSPDLQKQYTNFLNSYLTRLIQINDDRTIRNILELPAHKADKALLQLLTKSDSTGKLNIEDNNLTKMLRDSMGIQLANEAMVRYKEMLEGAVGLTSYQNPQGARDQLPENLTIDTKIGQGKINKLGHKITNRKVIGVGALALGVTLAAHGYYSADLLGVAVGGSLNRKGISTLAGKIRGSFREGIKIHMKPSEAAYDVISEDPEYVKAMTGVDVNDYRVVGERVVRNPAQRIAQTTRSMSDIQKEILSISATQREYYTKFLKVPFSQIDQSPAQYFSRFTDGQPQQAGTLIQELVAREFKPNDDGILDIWGQKPNNPAFGRLPTHGRPVPAIMPGFDRANLDNAGNLRRYREAQQKAMAAVAEQLIHAADEKEPLNTSGLRGKIKDYQTDGKVTSVKAAELTHKTDMINKDNETLSSEKQQLSQYQQKLEKITTVEDKLHMELAKLGVTNVTDAETKLQAEIGDITTTPPTGLHRELKNIDDAILMLINGYATTGLNPAVVGKAREDAIKTYGQELRERTNYRIQNLRTAIQDKLKAIENIRTMEQEVKTTRDIASATDETSRAVTDLIDTLKTDNDSLTTGGPPPLPPPLPPPPGYVLTQDELRDLPIDLLLERINEKHIRYTSFGWPASENDNPENRLKLEHGIIYARTQEKLEADPNYTAKNTALTNMTSWGITEQQLKTFPTGDLITLINRINGIDPTKGWPSPGTAAQYADIENAIDLAKEKFQVTIETYKEQQNRNVSRRDQLKRKGADTEQLKRAENQIEVTIGIMDRQNTLLANSDNIINNPGTYADSARIDTTSKTYSQSEKDLGALTPPTPSGYYEIMDYLFAYRQRTDRDDYFKKISSILTPDELKQNLVSKFSLPNNRRMNLATTLRNFNDRIANGSIDRFDINDFVMDLVNTMNARAHAL